MCSSLIKSGPHRIFYRNRHQTVSINRIGYDRWRVVFDDEGVELWSDHAVRARVKGRLHYDHPNSLNTEPQVMEPPSEVCPKCTSIDTFLWDDECSIHKCNACRRTWIPKQDDWFTMADAEFTGWIHNASREDLAEALKRVREERQ